MMRLNHEFWCSVALSPGLKNWIEITEDKAPRQLNNSPLAAKQSQSAVGDIITVKSLKSSNRQ